MLSAFGWVIVVAAVALIAVAGIVLWRQYTAAAPVKPNVVAGAGAGGGQPMAEIPELTEADALKILHGEAKGTSFIVIVKSPNCGACRMLAPMFATAAAKNPSTTRFVQVNGLQARAVMTEFGIGWFPTLLGVRADGGVSIIDRSSEAIILKGAEQLARNETPAPPPPRPERPATPPPVRPATPLAAPPAAPPAAPGPVPVSAPPAVAAGGPDLSPEPVFIEAQPTTTAVHPSAHAIAQPASLPSVPPSA